MCLMKNSSRAVEGARYLYNFAGVADIAEAKVRPYDTINLNVMGNLQSC